ncbi:4-(cytidine 5'-diphospho)-2-C-methyl-D-erythritol kinase [Plastoroseomonas hellenica]|uniref:4-(cytidine 5'-diphospho)-2-C-methyl-D-erythritol kinase n=1 Tax=Plastoroseomonas hellenica TaxID=2687306 RepID=UPI001BAD5E0D|nr:4-(cytidine 5'-diphospho)-2-C-methyl-D-erythritol kinase [Plastoroseomonas hellenica]MBR0645105.1 4-(cytidine 5'-diphospho)-2-C-methyl-D-erythritol kinase [Plastoroseomonas hellenica]
MPESAPAKLNLFLQVTGRRPDGYHLLDSLVVFADIGDALDAAPAEALSLTLDGPEAGALAAEPDNLALRAARALADATDVAPQAALRLTKRLPVASGIGGGSADAAAALRVLARLWNLRLPADRMTEIALSLGADVPVCLASVPHRMRGVGEVLSAAPALPEFGLVLANPRIALSTPSVFRALAGRHSGAAALPAGWDDAHAMAADLASLANDLEPPAIAICPAVAEVLAALRALPGALLARMSGSGATCFAIMPDAESAARAAASLPAAWWRWGGGLARPASAPL